MTDLDPVTMPPLSRIPRVELLHAGTWLLGTGESTFDADDLAAAVAALECPGVRRPVLKLGHYDPRFNGEDGAPYDGQPAVGYIDNLATTMNGQGLVGDYVGMPGWLGGVMASAYPDRSIEAQWNFTCQIGHAHPFVLTAVALLGVSAPGVGTLQSLQDVAALYGVAAQAPPTQGSTPCVVTIRAAAASTADVPTGAMIALLPSDADAQRLAVEGAEPADELHVTLRYLGKAADIDADGQQQIIDVVTAIAGQAAPIDGDGFSVALFNPINPDRETCITLGINGDGLGAVHDAVESAVDGLGLDLPAPMSPWTAHLTLEYTDDADQVKALVDRTGPIIFDRIRVAFAGVATDIPLSGTSVAASRKDSTMPNPTPLQVAAGVSVDDVRSQYYSNAPYENWITEMELNPLQLIVCDGSDRTWRVPVTISGETVTFGSPVEVVVQYIDKTGTPVAAGAQKLVYASRAESRPEVKAGEPPVEPEPEPEPEPVVEPTPDPAPAPVDESPTETPAAEPVQPPEEEDHVSPIPSGVASRLGLADDADEVAVLAALDATIAKANQPLPEPVAAGAPKLPDGVVAIDKATLEELKASAADGREARKQQVAEARERIVDGAIQAGKVTPARRDHWLAQYDADRDGTVEVLASLEPVFPVGDPVGYSSTTEPAVDDDKAFAGMFPPDQNPEV